MYKLNNISFESLGITAGRIKGEGIALKGIFDLPMRIGKSFNDWQDENSIEPYVDADEIFLGGRTILFAGILKGSQLQNETVLSNLKALIDAYKLTIPFETPYGSYCVYIKKITPKFYLNGATFIIEFYEPEINASCGISTGETVYDSLERSGTARKNNCATGNTGSVVTMTLAAGAVKSTISVAAATLIAEQQIRDDVQAYANNNGTCSLNLPIYYNDEKTGYRTRNNCSEGYSGSVVSHTVPSHTYSIDSAIDPTASKEKANLLAQAEIDAVLTEAYANENGTCDFLVSFIKTGDFFAPFSYGGGLHTQVFKVGEFMQPGTKYNMMLYGIMITVVSVSGDTAESIANALILSFNAVTNWNILNLKPTGAITPDAISYSAGYITVWLDYSASVEIWIGDPPYWNTLQA